MNFRNQEKTDIFFYFMSLSAILRQTNEITCQERETEKEK